MRAVMLVSGGIDSTVLLASRYDVGNECVAITFDYGQTHRREIAAAAEIAAYYEAEHHVIDITGLLGASALTGQATIPDGHAESSDATVVPGRNLVMLSIAAAMAAATGGGAVMFGANSDDAAAYKDCRSKFVDAMFNATYYGMDSMVTVHAPLITLTKRDIIALGQQLDAPLHLTWSCYRGGDAPCNRCGACESRNGAML